MIRYRPRSRIRWKDLFGNWHEGEIVRREAGGCWVRKLGGATGLCFVTAADQVEGRQAPPSHYASFAE